MFTRGRTHSDRRNRDRPDFGRRRRQIGPANTSANIPPESRRERHTIDTSARARSQHRGEVGLENTAAGLNENQHQPQQKQGDDDYKPSPLPPDEVNGEGLANDTSSHGYTSATYVHFSQQSDNGHDQTTLGDIEIRTGNHINHAPLSQTNIHPSASAYSSLSEYVSQQQAASNHALESWRAEASRDGPLRVVPELLSFSDWSYHPGNNFDQESETCATGGGTP
ncbi:hypothetical protein F5Y05DRAFT_237350 [Hypoxylon sp. FL0543]|nr:hypothetical protein F5Y05DRAFT_237350 [Hypoxylon sp. FL0543]